MKEITPPKAVICGSLCSVANIKDGDIIVHRRKDGKIVEKIITVVR